MTDTADATKVYRETSSAPSYEYISVESKTARHWRELTDFRFIMAVQGPQVLGPALQRAWQCTEDGSAEWRTVPTHMVSAAEYLAAVSPR